VVPLCDLLGATAASLRDRVIEARGVAGRIAAVEAWLGERVSGLPEADPLVAYLLRRLERPHGVRIAALAEEVGYSERQVLARFKRAVGLGPKQYARIRRFQLVLEALGAPGTVDIELTGAPLPAPDWADLAAGLGYVDQAHFTHEFNGFAGMTPSAYVAAYRGLSNYLPITLLADESGAGTGER
jgi:AraC-like DNA-binding protein